jgi:hypothetical protein
MSPVVIALDLLLVSLLVLTLVLGVRLNGRLKGLKQSHAGFEKAVVELNQAAARAEAGLAALRETSSEAHDALLERIDIARALTTRLERATFQAEKAAEAVVKAKADLPAPAPLHAAAASRAQTPSVPMSSSLATIAALVGDVPRTETRGPETRGPEMRGPEMRGPEMRATEIRGAEMRGGDALAAGAGSARRARSTFDEDLFEGEEVSAASRSVGPSTPVSAYGARLSRQRGRPQDDRR